MLDMLLYDKYGNAVPSMTQWDSNQTLYAVGMEYPSAPYFQFETVDIAEAISMHGVYMTDGSLAVVVPNILLMHSHTITIYIYLPQDGGGGKVVGKLLLPVKPRKRPSDYEYVDNTNDEPYATDEPDISNGLFPGDFYPGDNIYPQG